MSWRKYYEYTNDCIFKLLKVTCHIQDSDKNLPLNVWEKIFDESYNVMWNLSVQSQIEYKSKKTFQHYPPKCTFQGDYTNLKKNICVQVIIETWKKQQVKRTTLCKDYLKTNQHIDLDLYLKALLKLDYHTLIISNYFCKEPNYLI